jgi:signal-transduction protein with cAMP-binding, CBS, and nucleotidyltransferase domain
MTDAVDPSRIPPHLPDAAESAASLHVTKGEDAGLVPAPSDLLPLSGELSVATAAKMDPLESLFGQYVHLMRDRGLALLGEAEIEPAVVQDFISKNFDSLVGGLAEICMAEIGPPPTEFCILGLGSLSREEASPYSDLDFAIAIKEDSPVNRNYFLSLCTKMNEKLMKLNEHRKPNRGIAFCEGGLNPHYTVGRSNIAFGSLALLDTPEQLAKWSSPELPDFDRRKNSASEGVIKKALQQTHLMFGDEKLFVELETRRKGILDSPLPAPKPPITLVRQANALTLLEGSTPLGKSTAASLDLKNTLARPLQEIVGGLSLFYGIDEPNIVRAIDKLVKAGHLDPDLGGPMKEYYNLAYMLRAQAQLGARKEVDNIKLDGSDAFVTPELVAKLEAFQPLLLILRQKQGQFCENAGTPNPFV